ncbi:MAG: hypothetical protein AAGN46_14535 [Acidobacteriota bacterium]
MLRQPVAAGIGLPVFLATVVAGCLVPIWNLAFLLFALAPAVGGVPAVCLDLIDGRRVGRRAFLAGFRRYQRCLSLFWLGYLVLAAFGLPLLLALWFDRHLTPPAARPWLFGGGGVLWLVGAGWLMRRYLLVPWVAFDLEPSRSVEEVLTTAEARSAAEPGATAWAIVFCVGVVFAVPWALGGAVGAIVEPPQPAWPVALGTAVQLLSTLVAVPIAGCTLAALDRALDRGARAQSNGAELRSSHDRGGFTPPMDDR